MQVSLFPVENCRVLKKSAKIKHFSLFKICRENIFVLTVDQQYFEGFSFVVMTCLLQLMKLRVILFNA